MKQHNWTVKQHKTHKQQQGKQDNYAHSIHRSIRNVLRNFNLKISNVIIFNC
jgi:hypothetical protein